MYLLVNILIRYKFQSTRFIAAVIEFTSALLKFHTKRSEGGGYSI